jgi:DNA repair protein RadC
MLFTIADGKIRRASKDDVIREARALYGNVKGAVINAPAVARDIVASKLSGIEREVFAVMFLDNRHHVLSYEELFYGTIDGASVYPREVVKAALKVNAAAVILSHNHPSGASEPSRADEAITKRLKEALEYIDVRVLDHLIVGNNVTSMAERGLI